mmetsp:Transcript_35644/g.101582  ORF Transcript_35644/g.101582 Transcript_35644/m.101582 type:complete len:205 (+) Transcript_35644:753-1367(+)
MKVLCTNKSSPPLLGWMKPMPRASTQPRTMPFIRAPPPALEPLLAPHMGCAAGALPQPFPEPAHGLSCDAAPCTLAAQRLPLTGSTLSSNTTWAPTTSHEPSSSELRCTKMSSPPESGAMKPMPRSSCHDRTVPERKPGVVTALAGGTRDIWVICGICCIRGIPQPPQPLPPEASAPDTFFAIFLPRAASQPSSNDTGSPTCSH